MSLNQEEIKKRVIDKLQNNPIIGHACKNIGVARSTFYRFREEDADFNMAVKKAQRIGRAVTCDAAESRILSLINSDNEDITLKASKTILGTYNHRYQSGNIGVNLQKAIMRSEMETMKKEKQEAFDGYTELFRISMDIAKGDDKVDEEGRLTELKEALVSLLEKIDGAGKNDQDDNEEENLKGLI